MNLIISKQELNKALQQVAKAISSRSPIPILSGIKIEATAEQVIFTASDTDITIQSFVYPELNGEIAYELIEPGNAVLPAKIFTDIVRKMPQDQIEIQANEQFQAIIRSGQSEIQLMGMDPEEYPLMPTLDEHQQFSLKSEVLKSMIRQTSFAVSTNESTPILTGILWSLTDQVLKFVSTDRHRLASRKSTIETDPDLSFKNIVISGRTLNELNKLLPEEDTNIDIFLANNQVLFQYDSILFYSRILDGMYPDTSKIIPQTYKTELVVNTKILLDAIDRANLISREEKTNIVKLSMIDHELIEISSSQSELGRMKEEIQVDSSQGEPLQISFNSKYMLDVLKVIDCEKIFIGFVGTMNPIIIKPADQDHILHLILPYRTAG